MKVSVLKLFLIIMLTVTLAMPVFAQQPGNGVREEQGQTVSTDSAPSFHLAWGYKMLLGLIAGVAIGLALRPRRIQVDDKTRRDRAA